MSIRTSVILLLMAASMSLAARVDIGVDTILRNRLWLYVPGEWFSPKAAWHNYGDTAAGFLAWFRFYHPLDSLVYSESVLVSSLEPGSADTLVFPDYQFPGSGIWTARCSTAASGDTSQANDTLSCQLWAEWG